MMTETALVAEFLQHPIIADILARLSAELPADLYYHSLHHTLHVLTAALRFAEYDGLKHRELELLAIAAAYHDAGYIQARVDNEPIGAAMAAEAMKAAGVYTKADIDTVQNMILSTACLRDGNGLSRVPCNHLSRYLLDADLSLFGHEDYFTIAEQLRREMGMDRKSFLNQSLDMITGHDWFTTTAFEICEKQKLININRLKDAIAKSDLSV
jgi:uncharacterized protein